MIDPSWKGLQRFISDAQLHKPLCELAMHDPLTLAEVYQEGKKINLILWGEWGKKGRSWTLRTIFSWNSLWILHLVSVSRTAFWPVSLYGISFASHHCICSKTFPFTPSLQLHTWQADCRNHAPNRAITPEHMLPFPKLKHHWLPLCLDDAQSRWSRGSGQPRQRGLTPCTHQAACTGHSLHPKRYRIWHTKVSTIFTYGWH